MVKLLLMLALCFEHAWLIIPIVEIMKEIWISDKIG